MRKQRTFDTDRLILDVKSFMRDFDLQPQSFDEYSGVPHGSTESLFNKHNMLLETIDEICKAISVNIETYYLS
jgi:hypothetical protein